LESVLLTGNRLDSPVPFELDGYHVEPSILRIKGEAGETRLEAKVMGVLVYLVQHAGQPVSRSELEEHIWPGRVVTEDVVTNTILKLRRAFGDSARHPRVIETIPKRGYRLIAGVKWLDGSADQASVAQRSVPKGEKPDRRKGLWWGAGATLLILMLLMTGGVLEREESSAIAISPSPGKPAVAILPFTNLGIRPEQDYFANGITADLITDLSKVSGLLVIAPGSVFAYKDSNAGPRQLYDDLGANYVVVGSVQRAGTRLRVNVQLIEANDERALWGERYEGPISDVFAVQDALTSDVIAALEVKLAPAEREFLAKRPTASVAAYDDYLKGLEAHGRRTREQNQLARIYFQRALDLDRKFARAYTGMAMTHARDAMDGWVNTPVSSLELAAEYAEEAAKMDPSLPQVHFVTGLVDLFRRRHMSAIDAAQRAIQIDPNYADAHALSAWILNYAGRTDEAVPAMEKAIRLNPRPTASYLEVLGEIRFMQRQYLESASVFQRVLEINPNYMRARMWNVIALVRAGATDEAAWEATELMVSSPDFSIKQLDFAFPFKDPRVLDTLQDGLRKAGLPH
jgi:TolB-like protein/DNA-binding winged helix-turn-helix (wHTH) protein/Tfp pilus assembly protein PilF